MQIGDKVSIANTKRASDLTLAMPDGDDQAWNDVTIDGTREGHIVLDAAIALSLADATVVSDDGTISARGGVGAGSGGRVTGGGAELLSWLLRTRARVLRLQLSIRPLSRRSLHRARGEGRDER